MSWIQSFTFCFFLIALFSSVKLLDVVSDYLMERYFKDKGLILKSFMYLSVFSFCVVIYLAIGYFPIMIYSLF